MLRKYHAPCCLTEENLITSCLVMFHVKSKASGGLWERDGTTPQLHHQDDWSILLKAEIVGLRGRYLEIAAFDPIKFSAGSNPVSMVVDLVISNVVISQNESG